ncbi:hypothetical protein [Nonomuraea turcica]|uniref:hypothetical protein n=1 Tax=Nonomuraea sp. G32 TaxID=3067274 RepID=UPI00273CCBD1|nr:hypothetical protein [Nonomuraea sp. G32]MDP4510204.1 hypothetical protein [Nonomuraea sp. G32]
MADPAGVRLRRLRLEGRRLLLLRTTVSVGSPHAPLLCVNGLVKLYETGSL